MPTASPDPFSAIAASAMLELPGSAAISVSASRLLTFTVEYPPEVLPLAPGT